MCTLFLRRRRLGDLEAPSATVTATSCDPVEGRATRDRRRHRTPGPSHRRTDPSCGTVQGRVRDAPVHALHVARSPSFSQPYTPPFFAMPRRIEAGHLA